MNRTRTCIRWAATAFFLTMVIAGQTHGAAIQLSPRSLTWDQQTFLECTVTDLAPGETGGLALFVDVNKNGIRDGGDYRLAAFRVADGVAAPWGAATIVSDTDGLSNGVISARISYYGVSESFLHGIGDYLWVYTNSSPTPAEATLPVQQTAAATWITGRVIDMVSSNPAAGARVELLYFSDTTGYRPAAWADTNGNFRLDVPADVPAHAVRGVLASAKGYFYAMTGPDEMGYLSGWLFTNAPVAGGNALPAPLKVIPAWDGLVGLVSGRVVTASGFVTSPVPRVIVRFDQHDDHEDDDPIGAWAVTDADGRYSMAIPFDMEGEIFAADPLLAMRGLVGAAVELPARTNNASVPDLICPPATALARSTACRDDGAPLPGAHLDLSGDSVGSIVYAYGNGVTQAVYEAPLSGGLVYEGGAEDAWLRVNRLVAPQNMTGFAVPPGLFTNAPFVLQPAGLIQGRVTAAVGGQPLSMGRVQASGQNEQERSLTDHDGRYAMPLPPGTYHVETHRESFAGYIPRYSNDVTLATNGAVVDFALQQAAYIRGMVAVPPGSSPTGIWVNIYRVTGEFNWEFVNNSEVTNGNGAYAVSVPPGTNYLAIAQPMQGFQVWQFYNGKYNSPEADKITVTMESQPTNINFNIVNGMRITGQITDETGQPKPDAWISVHKQGVSNEWEWMTTVSVNSNGSYAVNLPTNWAYVVQAQAGEPYGQMYFGQVINASQSPQLHTNVGAVIEGIDIQLYPVGVVEGSIVPVDAASDGAMWRITEGVETNWQYGGSMFYNFPTGQYTAVFAPASGWLTPADQPFIVQPGQTTRVEGVYTRTAGIRVFFSPVEAESFASWRLLEGTDTFWHTHGQVVAPLTAGTYTITFNEPYGWHKPADAIVTLTNNQFFVTNAFYQAISGEIACFLSPTGAVSDGAKWRAAGRTNWWDSGVFTSLPLGVYTLEFAQVSGWTAPASFPVTLASEGQRLETQAVYACHLSISPTNALFTHQSATGTIAVAAGTGCGWTAQVAGGADWVSILEGATGSGSGNVRYALLENTARSNRQAHITVEGLIFSLTQEAAEGGFGPGPLQLLLLDR